MVEIIRNDCFWYLDETTQKIRAMCVECGRKHNKEWYWNGSAVGYGDYDLSCSVCSVIIYQRGELESDAACESPGE